MTLHICRHAFRCCFVRTYLVHRFSWVTSKGEHAVMQIVFRLNRDVFLLQMPTNCESMFYRSSNLSAQTPGR